MTVVWLVLGAITGSIITSIIWSIWSASGCLRIDQSNPEKDTYRIEISDLDKLSKKKRVVLKVDNNADLSQK